MRTRTPSAGAAIAPGLAFRVAQVLAITAATSAVVGCAAKSASEAASPAADYAKGVTGAPGQPMPAAEPAPAPFSAESSKPRTLGEASDAIVKAERDLDGALDPEKPIPLGTDRCVVVCKALASMRDATTELCGLVTDDRCGDAKSRLARAEARAREACPVCAGT